MNHEDLMNNTLILQKQLQQLYRRFEELTAHSTQFEQEQPNHPLLPLSWRLKDMPAKIYHPWRKIILLWVLLMSVLSNLMGLIGAIMLVVGILLMRSRFPSLIKFLASLGIFMNAFFFIMGSLDGELGASLGDPFGLAYNIRKPFFVIVLLFVASYFLVTYYVRKKIGEENDMILAYNTTNEDLNRCYRESNQELLDACHSIVQLIYRDCAGIENTVARIQFPPDYVTLHAVNFFVHGLRNDRADDYRRLIDLYEEHNYRQQMLNGQRELINLVRQVAENQQRVMRLMEYNNAFQAANLAATIQTQIEARAAATQITSAVYNTYY